MIITLLTCAFDLSARGISKKLDLMSRCVRNACGQWGVIRHAGGEYMLVREFRGIGLKAYHVCVLMGVFQGICRSGV